MSKTRKITVVLLSVLLLLSLAMFAACKKDNDKGNEGGETTEDLFSGFDFYLNPSEFDATIYNETTEIGEFIIQASTEKAVQIDSNAKTPIDMPYAFTKRLKLGDTDLGTLDRTISFYLEKQATVKVYAYSGSSSDPNRELRLYKNGVAEPIFAKPTETAGSIIEPFEIKTTEAGSYYLADSKGVNIYLIGITYTGEAPKVEKGPWSDVQAPVLSDPMVANEGKTINVRYSANIGTNGGDKLVVKMLNDANEVVGKTTVLRFGETGSVFFTPKASGVYHFEAELERAGEEEIKKTTSELKSDFFNLVLTAPTVRGRTGAGGKMVVTVTKTPEADKYVLEHSKDYKTWESVELDSNTQGEEITTELSGYAVNQSFYIRVTATRTSTNDSVTCIPATVTLRPTEERDWVFASFGQSTKASLNNMDRRQNNIFDGVKLNSVNYDLNTLYASSKGGKFTYGSHDGISYYYTRIKASEEDFKLKARVVVDYLNPTPDGQEGFALLVRDSIGVDGDTAYYYTNSVAAIATKIQYEIGASRTTITDGLGARFVTGVKSTTETPAAGSFVQRMYPFQNDAVYPTVNKNTDGYTIEVEKVNNCYYTRKYNTQTGDLEVEKALYHDGSINNGQDGKDQLLMIDKEYVYVGFAVARGCNATFKDINFQVTPKSNEVVPIKDELIVTDYKVMSSPFTSTEDYELDFFANADGKVDIKLNEELVVDGESVTSMKDYIKTFKLEEGTNYLSITFTPNADYIPGQYQKMDTYEPQTIEHEVTYRKYGDKDTILYVAPTDAIDTVPGTPTGDGTKEKPLDLQTAINYCLPGQTIYMTAGSYRYGLDLRFDQGNDGTSKMRKVLMADPEATSRPIIDFENKGSGIKMWGQYWHFKGFDVARTKFGSKGIQLSGKNNIIEDIHAYENGDSGISVAGRSTDPYVKWPSGNLILNCTAYMNKDQAEEDADGFAAKLYCADGNVFRGCISYCNADDGWDLYAKTETGTIGAVLIENCLTFGNGFNIDGTPTKGNGNGFKMGGESLPGGHKIVNSVSFGNKLKGIDSNSCPDDKMINCTSVYNGSYNYAFYSTKLTSFEVKNCLSLLGGKSDQIATQREMPIRNETNYLFTLIADQNISYTKNYPEDDSKAQEIDMSIFKGWTGSIETFFGFEFAVDIDTDETYIKNGFQSAIDRLTKVRRENGTINTDGFLELTDEAKEKMPGVGADIYDFSSSKDDLYYIPEFTVREPGSEPEKESGCNKGCKSEITFAGFTLGFVAMAFAVVLLLRKQKAN